jgi:arylformamidase
MVIFDISIPITPEMPVWPGDPPVILEKVTSMDAGDHDNVSRLACSVHTGTHVDAPHHFLNDHRTVEKMALDILTGPAEIVQLADDIALVTADTLEKATIPDETIRLLIKTRNSQLWASGNNTFYKDFVGISQDGAEWIVRRGIKLVGIDYLSVAPFQQSIATHETLLKTGIIILEGVNLSAVSPGRYELYCLPLKLEGSDGALARVILIG